MNTCPRIPPPGVSALSLRTLRIRPPGRGNARTRVHGDPGDPVVTMPEWPFPADDDRYRALAGGDFPSQILTIAWI